MRWVPSTTVVRGRRLSWRAAGHGPALLLVLHDAGGATRAAPVWDELAQDHAVVELDLPGTGGSDPPAGLEGPGALAQLLVDWQRRVLGPGAVVVGSSLGAWFAIELALAGARPCALVLATPAGLAVPSGVLWELYEQVRADRPADIVAAQRYGTAGLAEAAATIFSSEDIATDQLDRARALRVPTTLLWGARDPLVPVAHGDAYAGAIPGARLEVLEGCGHLVVLERPDAVARAVRAVAR